MLTFNRLAATKRALEKFFQVTKSPFYLTVIDNGSTDGTQSFLNTFYTHGHSGYCRGFEVILNETNLGVAKARNQGLLALKSDAEFIATVDNDVLLPDNWLEQCTDIMQANQKWVIGVNFNQEKQKYPTVTLNGCTFLHKNQTPQNVGAGCVVFPRQLHDKIGFFDDLGTLYGEEDTLFFTRAVRAGYQIGYLSTSGTHFGPLLDKGDYQTSKTQARQHNMTLFRKLYTRYSKEAVYINKNGKE
jgi:GT2 family glycosyltransferase